MKFICGVMLVVVGGYCVWGLQNPDEVMADSNSANNGEFIRRNQPPEHIIIPLISNQNVSYFPHDTIEQYLSKTKQSARYQIKRYKSLSTFNTIRNQINR
jgi:hypothetical protein